MKTKREWTKEELDRVWPLPEGWVWARVAFREDEGWVWCAQLDWRNDSVWVSEGVVGFIGEETPVEATLAVCMVALGLDSFAAIADAMVDRAVAHALSVVADRLPGTRSLVAHGRAAEAYAAAEIVRRGTMRP